MLPFKLFSTLYTHDIPTKTNLCTRFMFKRKTNRTTSTNKYLEYHINIHTATQPYKTTLKTLKCLRNSFRNILSRQGRCSSGRTSPIASAAIIQLSPQHRTTSQNKNPTMQHHACLCRRTISFAIGI